uniref:Uncharacterized protein n=1 Tax=Arundo donax TaxID=35708 RepID=A0A0A9AJ69_ARUDO
MQRLHERKSMTEIKHFMWAWNFWGTTIVNSQLLNKAKQL